MITLYFWEGVAGHVSLEVNSLNYAYFSFMPQARGKVIDKISLVKGVPVSMPSSYSEEIKPENGIREGWMGRGADKSVKLYNLDEQSILQYVITVKEKIQTTPTELLDETWKYYLFNNNCSTTVASILITGWLQRIKGPYANIDEKLIKQKLNELQEYLTNEVRINKGWNMHQSGTFKDVRKYRYSGDTIQESKGITWADNLKTWGSAIIGLSAGILLAPLGMLAATIGGTVVMVFVILNTPDENKMWHPKLVHELALHLEKELG